MNIYKLLTESEKAQVDAYSLKINTEKRSEPLFFKSQLIGKFMLQLFLKNHPEQAENIRKEQKEKNAQVRERHANLTWEACIEGYKKPEKVKKGFWL